MFTFPDSAKKHKRYCDDVAAKSRSDNSVKKLFLIALIPDVLEQYKNVRYVWKKLHYIIQKFFTPLIKLANVLARITGRTSFLYIIALGNYNICISILNIKGLTIDFEE